MIRNYRVDDIDRVLDIWLSASVEAHDFIEAKFWRSKVSDMRDIYIPASETRVYEHEGEVVGFYSLYEDNLAALFVAPSVQGRGVGSKLLDDAKLRRAHLQLCVYKDNTSSIRFYQKHGFSSLGEQTDPNTGHLELIMQY